MKLFTYTALALATLSFSTPPVQAQAPALLTVQNPEVRLWTDLPVGASAGFERSRTARRGAKAPEADPSGVLLRNRQYPLLHTSQEGGSASDYFLVSSERTSGAPLWIEDLFSLRNSMQRSTTYETSGLWMGLDPMNLKATLKLEIAKVINVLD